MSQRFLKDLSFSRAGRGDFRFRIRVKTRDGEEDQSGTITLNDDHRRAVG
jgi:hypothetical protein